MTDIGKIDILTESDAWSLLENALLDRIAIETDVFHLNIGPWPVLKLKLEGEKYRSSINTKMMSAFIDLQNNVFRTYAKMQYDAANGRLLTNEDKYALELMVEVSPGSSELKINLQLLAKKLIEGAIHKMDGKHFVVLGIAGLLSWSSASIINGYISSQTERKKMEVQVSLSQEETRRLEIMRAAASAVPYVGINNMMSEARVRQR